ncbi:L-histidine N(alpha)-methyltransferase [Chitinophaga nivalis]|uniref:L-histidine N(Alpha)-methyltransferase n=1 Tax=Chitinophaga nivalis TaxID=2991709 RepID=A0ABT3IHT7_9BACT|nr:L-histidine N(alpha)-methyltransferase [Chitinophaga nivalis]MCW3466787.1 L-histidine N(alpha)-methyltransferase [Chitinophaga nivalis]MCW3483522.1 L-histidine N(alpha)-methyltransferase [Chitinophaga nivalis]
MHTTTVIPTYTASRKRQQHLQAFYHDVVKGLTAPNKYLDAKYFYDAAGDVLFQQIMQCPEYYLTGCEMEIFTRQAAQIAHTLQQRAGNFDVVELGAGDATKSIHLLRQLLSNGVDYTYFPIDISANVINQLQINLPAALPQLRIQGLNGEYFQMLQQAAEHTSRKKVLLFMGSNIGNFTTEAARGFCQQLHQYMQPGDLLMIGFDLKKHPQVILDAYNDAAGITRAFNLNLLHRINHELNADFDVQQFMHYPTYDPGTGTCSSYLISLTTQQVHIGEDVCIDFAANEALHMEISQKYTLEEITALARQTGFTPVTHFADHKKWFVDVLWERS